MADSKSSDEIKFYKPKLRFIIPISEFHYPKKLFNEFKRGKYIFRVNYDFPKVIKLCKEIKRKDQETIKKVNQELIEIIEMKKTKTIELENKTIKAIILIKKEVR